MTMSKTYTVNKEQVQDKLKDETETPKEEVVVPVGTLEVFKFSDCLDRFLICMGILASMINGVAFPLFMIIFGEMIDTFSSNEFTDEKIDGLLKAANATLGPNANLTYKIFYYTKVLNHTIDQSMFVNMDKLMGDIGSYSIWFVALGCGMLLLSYFQVATWVMSAGRQCHRMRLLLFRAVMRQEMAWFDAQKSGELNNRLSDDINKIHDGIGDKLGQFFQWFTCSIVSLVVGFVYGWKLTLVVLSIGPLLAIAGFLFTKLATAYTEKELESYGEAGAISEEVLGSIRTVAAFGGEEVEEKRYSSLLGNARDFGVKKGFTSGLTMGFTWFLIFIGYALGFWYGAKLIRDEPENYSPGRALIVFFAVLIASMAIGQSTPPLQNFGSARGAARAVFDLIERESVINPMDEVTGERPESVTGDVTFSDVTFHYATRPDVPVLRGLELAVAPGQTVALVGSSGCGKSTTVQLLQRFYDPVGGSVKLDGRELSSLNVSWLRAQIGVVSQEPVLFATSILENIRFGRDGVTDEEVQAACESANAAEFIRDLPEGLETLVGDRGTQLSGGQKQRIAIARALVRQPRLMLLDEATSALDTQSEAVVQEALDRAQEGRTTLVIAHRLSTVRNADKIVVISEGRVVETGTHDELMAIENGHYFNLASQQTKKDAEESETESDDEEEVGVANGNGVRKISVDSPKSPVERAISIEKDEPEDEKDKKKKDGKDKEETAGFGELLKLNGSEWHFILCGCLASLVNGGVQPAFAMLFAEVLVIMGNPDLEKQKAEANFYACMFLVVAVASLVAQFLQSYMFAKSGEALVMRCRQKMFAAMLKQEMGWFDLPDNNLGALTTRLSTEASAIQGITGVRLGIMLMTVSNMGVAIILSFFFSWQLTLAVLAFVPFMLIGGWLQVRVMQGYANSDKGALEKAGKIAVESFESVRTVAGLGREKTMCERYSAELTTPHKRAMRMVHLQAAAFGFSQCIIFFAYAVLFYLGAYLIKEGKLDFLNLFRVFGAIIFGAMGAGNASAMAPDYGKAQSAANSLFALLKRKPAIDSSSKDGDSPASCSGNISFSNVHFRYPARPDVAVLRGLELTLDAGQRVALVGASGCGKSTTVSMIMRFYDQLKGSVQLDGQEISELNIRWLRQQIGIVSQEPVLFGRSVADNIAYGDVSRKVPLEEIVDVARQANIHDFVDSLPMKYDTMVGEKGTQLSGGQKQRIAIARALVRQPRLMLLDEATSALDTQSEAVVQEALDRAQQGRTTLIIAHRLSTVRNADKIAVIHAGKVREVGTHDELMKLEGFYWKLVKRQELRAKE